MEKFPEREWLNSFQESRNPWSSSSTYINVGSLGKIVSLAERTGQITKEIREAQRNEIADRASRLSPSIKLISILVDLTNLQKSLNKVKVLIHHHQLQDGTKDITDASILEEKTKKMEELSLSLSELVDKKEELISRLQQPYVGDYMSIDAEYHKCTTDSVRALSNTLCNLTNHLECITWSRKLSLEDGELEKTLGSISSALAQLQGFSQSLCLSRNFMSKLMENDSQSTAKYT